MAFVNEKLNEFNSYLRNKRVAVIGLGISNMPLLDYLFQNNARVTVFDIKSIDQIPRALTDKMTSYSMEFSFGENYLEKLVGFDIIFRSPSCLPTKPELVAEAERGAIITTEVELLMEMFPGKMIGVTGSDGKTITSSLIYDILKNNGYSCYLGGNIGIPLFTKLSEMTPDDILVLELSSFQLMGMEVSPEIAVVTNITPNHLNVHKDYDEFIEAEKIIYKYQNDDGLLILNYDDEIAKTFEKDANGKVIFFSSTQKIDDGYIVDGDIIKECEDKLRRHILNTNELTIEGNHNFENVCIAIAATKTLVDTDLALETIKSFKGMEHRLELFKEINNVKWYNDSASSTPARTLAALNSFDKDIVLIAGGYDKNLDYKPMAKTIVDKVKTLVLIGQTADKIFDAVKEELENRNKSMNLYICESLASAVQLAHKSAKENEIVIFSPASASFDMFDSFADRGNKFKEIVNELK